MTVHSVDHEKPVELKQPVDLRTKVAGDWLLFAENLRERARDHSDRAQYATAAALISASDAAKDVATACGAR